MGYAVYSVDQEVNEFFTKTTVTRNACDQRAKQLVGGDVMLVPVQGVCSYTVYAGENFNSVVQFRLKSLALPLKTAELAYQVYGSLAPEVSFDGQMGEDTNAQEALFVYVMPRMEGISRLDYTLIHCFSSDDDAPENRAARLNLITDVAGFFARSWKTPQLLDAVQVDTMHQAYHRDLSLLLHALPPRFQPIIKDCLHELPSIMALPKVLTHKDFGDSNILVHPDTSHLLGVIDWAEAKIEPFGVNFYTIERLMGTLHLRNGAIRYPDYNLLYDAFWSTLKAELGDGMDDSTLSTIRSALVMGFLLSNGFTSRLANKPTPIPISDDDKNGAYKMLTLDSYLVRTETRFPFLNEHATHSGNM